jgi:exonuclease SbcC
MKLLRVQAKNFRSFADLDLDLNVDGLIAVVGDNGAGKSTIFSAIEWGLYGGPRGRGALPARRDGCPEGEECFVEVHFEVGGRVCGVRRIDKTTARLRDLSTGETICTTLDETSRRVATLLGLSREMFRGTFYARQREVQALEADNHKRVEQVELLLGIERLRRATGYAEAAVKEQRAVVRPLESDAPDVDALRAETDRIEREAQHAAPLVQAAEARLAKAKTAKTAAAEQLKALRAQERTMMERSARAQTGRTAAEHEARAAQALRAQVTDADSAAGELEKLSVLAKQVERLAAAERELDHRRAAHERAEGWRGEQHKALKRAAQLADRLAVVREQLVELAQVPVPTLVGADGVADGHGGAARNEVSAGDADWAVISGGDDGNGAGGAAAALNAQIRRREATLDQLRARDRQLGGERRAADAQSQALREQLTRAERAAELDLKLAGLGDAEQTVQRATERWHALSAQRDQLAENIRHDTEHRDAVLAGEEQAACPTCKRAYDEGELDEIVAGFERDLAAARERLEQLDTQLAKLKTQGAQARAHAEQLRTLAADRRALGDVVATDGLDALRQRLATAERQVGALAAEAERIEARTGELSGMLPALRERVRQLDDAERQLANLLAQHRQAEGEARLYAQQLAGAGSDGYDAAIHTRVSTQLAEATAAAHRCSALRAKVDGLELLRRRAADQERKSSELQSQLAELDAQVGEVAVSAQELDGAEVACAAAEREIEAAQAASIAAERQASTDSDAVTAARARLAAARQQAGQLRSAREELRLRGHVAEALSALREDASRRARPTLEHETALLLGQITRGRYSVVEMSPSYQLQIADGRQLHPVKRFSGGEQNLAALCLRLALSRTLARSRGAETGFVLLDEVFGSQDPERRRALLEQLHAIAESEFRQVFVISHTGDVTAHCDLHINVSREGDKPSVAVGPRR